MAFGTNSDDVEIKVTLNTEEAKEQAQKLKADTESALKGISSAASSPTAALRDLTKSFIEGNSRAAALATSVQGLGAKLAPLAPYAIAATAGVAGLAIGFKALINVAAEGDRFGDIAEAFEENAAKAGVLADELRGNLSKAFQDAVSDANLMIAANKAFAAGIAPGVFDDLAAAAKRYADATGGDATQSLNELISGVNSGREALLRKFGTVKDGVLILDAFSQKTYEAGQANRNVTDIYEQFTASLRNTYNEVARAVNESELLKLVTRAVTSTISGLASVVGSVAKAFISFTNDAIRLLRREIELLTNGFSVLLELISQVRAGEMPSLSKASQAVSKQLAETAKQSEKTGRVFVKLGGDIGKAGKAAKDFKKDIADALQQSDIGLNDLFGIESFALPGTTDSLRTKLKTAFKQINPIDIINDLRDVRTAFLDGITGKPEEIAEETKKRIAIFEKELQKAKQELEQGVTIGPRADGSAADKEKLASTIFGIDAGEMAPALASAIEGALSSGLSLAAQAVTTGVGREAAGQVGAAVGAAIGAAIGSIYGPGGAVAGSAIGGVVGQFLGEVAAAFGDDGAGTKARKAADRFFADMFDADRLSVIVNGQIQRIRDLSFTQGITTTDGTGLGLSDLARDNPSFDSDTVLKPFQELPALAQAAFQAVGNSFEEFLGVSDDISGQIGAILFNNIGGSLENLQVLVQTTGRSFEELGDQIINAFFDGTLSIEQAAAELEALQELFTPGIPQAIGDIEQAVANLQVALRDGKGSRILVDSLRDIGAEALELGFKEFPQAADRIAQAFGFSAQQVTAFFQAMKTIGIANMTDLVNASTAQLIELAKAINQITSGQAVTVQNITDPTAPSKTQVGGLPGNFSQGGFKVAPDKGSGGSKGKSAAERKAEELKRKREQEFQQVYKLLEASAAYEKILDRVVNKELARAEANKAIKGLFEEIKSATEAVTKAENRYQEALKKPKGKNLGELARQLEEAEKKLEKLTQTATEADKAFKFDLSKVTPLLDDLNKLGVLSRAVGVNIEGVTNTLVAGFLRGKISLVEFNKQLSASEEILGRGIPKEVGATKLAFQNLIEGGLEGGLFSTDAFRDIFSEFKEQFARESSGARKQQLAELTKEFDQSRDALQAALSGAATPGRIKELREQFEGADKALKDFKSSSNQAGFSDLRSELEKTFSSSQVQTFFAALEQSGITTFDEFENASNETVTQILADLQGLGFGFGETSQRVKDILKETDGAIVQANGGKDVLQAALDTIGKFNEAMGLLPGQAEAGAGVLATLSQGFDDIIEKVARLDGNTFENDLVFNIRTNGSSGEKGLIDALFGDGGGSIDIDVDGGPGVGGGLTSAQKAEFFRLRRKIKSGARLSAADKRRFEELNSLRAA